MIIEDSKFLEVLIQSIVQYPEKVKITQKKDDRGIFLRLNVDRRDMGLIIGKKGEHANAIKLLIKLRGLKLNNKVALKIEEPLAD